VSNAEVPKRKGEIETETPRPGSSHQSEYQMVEMTQDQYTCLFVLQLMNEIRREGD
jgi:hypothetical protein